jgi:hypothetical protein
MTKKQDRYALPVSPAAKRRAEKVAQRRAARPPRPAGEFSRRFLMLVAAGAAVAGLIGLSVAWPNGAQTALYAAVASALGWIVLAVAARLLQRRLARGARGRAVQQADRPGA